MSKLRLKINVPKPTPLTDILIPGENVLVGYVRVSTSDRSDAHLPTGLVQAFVYVREQDTLVVWRLDRLGRSLKHLIEAVTNLLSRVDFPSLTEPIDTRTAGGNLIFHVFRTLAEFE